MSDMTFTERKKLEELFQMEGGSVLDFTDRTFAEFVRDSVGLNIDDPIYHYGNGSTANRLRRLWMREPDHVVGRLLQALLDYCRPKVGNPTQER
ncbi:MAG: hypothetical protein RMJ35_05105, partial [Phycisphaerales bacterium]|nr:hypothetical protein [Phycisphaerales bacterium]